MRFILKKLRENPEIYSKLKKIYGNTIGLWSLKKLYLKKIGLWNGKRHIRLLENNKVDNLIISKINSKEPFLLARYGSVEFQNLFSKKEIDSLCNNAGFFPNNKKYLGKFRDIYFDSSKEIDILAVWNYLNHFINKLKISKYLQKAENLISLGNVGGIDHAWIKSLEGKRILIIHPFKKTIQKQYKKREKIGILPKFKSLEIIQAVQTIAGTNDPRFKNWFEALDYMKKEIDKKEKKFDIALIGCGAYGLPLGAYIKFKGKKAIHLGGSLQLLFGIIGQRWKENKNIKTNKYWTTPLKEDVPNNFKKVEGGCYW